MKVHNKENKQKIKHWIKKLKDIQQVDLPKAKIKTSYTIHKRGSDLDEIIYSEERVEAIQQEIASIKKVIRNLKREKK